MREGWKGLLEFLKKGRSLFLDDCFHFGVNVENLVLH